MHFCCEGDTLPSAVANELQLQCAELMKHVVPLRRREQQQRSPRTLQSDHQCDDEEEGAGPPSRHQHARVLRLSLQNTFTGWEQNAHIFKPRCDYGTTVQLMWWIQEHCAAARPWLLHSSLRWGRPPAYLFEKKVDKELIQNSNAHVGYLHFCKQLAAFQILTVRGKRHRGAGQPPPLVLPSSCTPVLTALLRAQMRRFGAIDMKKATAPSELLEALHVLHAHLFGQFLGSSTGTGTQSTAVSMYSAAASCRRGDLAAKFAIEHKQPLSTHVYINSQGCPFTSTSLQHAVARAKLPPPFQARHETFNETNRVSLGWTSAEHEAILESTAAALDTSVFHGRHTYATKYHPNASKRLQGEAFLQYAKEDNLYGVRLAPISVQFDELGTVQCTRLAPCVVINPAIPKTGDFLVAILQPRRASRGRGQSECETYLWYSWPEPGATKYSLLPRKVLQASSDFCCKGEYRFDWCLEEQAYFTKICEARLKTNTLVDEAIWDLLNAKDIDAEQAPQVIQKWMKAGTIQSRSTIPGRILLQITTGIPCVVQEVLDGQEEVLAYQLVENEDAVAKWRRPTSAEVELQQMQLTTCESPPRPSERYLHSAACHWSTSLRKGCHLIELRAGGVLSLLLH